MEAAKGTAVLVITVLSLLFSHLDFPTRVGQPIGGSAVGLGISNAFDSSADAETSSVRWNYLKPVYHPAILAACPFPGMHNRSFGSNEENDTFLPATMHFGSLLLGHSVLHQGFVQRDECFLCTKSTEVIPIRLTEPS